MHKYKLLILLFAFLHQFYGSLAQVSISPSDTKRCPPFEVSFKNNSRNLGPKILFEWKFSGDTNFTFYGFELNQPIRFTKPGAVLLMLTAYDTSGGKKKAVDLDIADITSIGPVFQASTDSVCLGEMVRFNLNPSDSTFLLDYGDGSKSPITFMKNKNDSIFEHTYQSEGTYMARLTGKDQCASYKLAQKVIVSKKAVIESYFTFDDNYISVNQKINIHPRYNVFGAKKAIWEFGDGNIYTYGPVPNDYISQSFPYPNDIEYTWNNSGIYPVKLSVTNRCGATSTFTDSVHVCNKYETSFSISNKEVCPGDSLGISIYGIVPKKLLWTFDDRTISTDPKIKYQTEVLGTHTLKLKYQNQCGSSDLKIDSFSVTKNIIPHSNYSLQYSGEQIFTGDTVVLISEQPGSPVIKNLLWSFGDGSFSDKVNTAHSWEKAGKNAIKLTLTNNCNKTARTTQTIDVKNKAVFHISKKEASTGETIYFNAIYPDYRISYPRRIWTYFWTFGDSTSSFFRATDHSYNKPGKYYINLTVTDEAGRRFTTTDSVVINCNLSNQFTGSFHPSAESGCPNDDIYFSADDRLKFLWDFGDGNFSTKANINHQYSTQGNYYPNVKITNLCGNDTTIFFNSIAISNNSDSKFQQYMYLSDTICIGSPAVYATFGGSSWLWNFGDGGSSNSSYGMHYYKSLGEKNVSVTVNRCSRDTILQKHLVVVDHFRPISHDGYTRLPEYLNLCPKDSIELIDQWIGADSVHWNWGDGNIEITENYNQRKVQHSYKDLGLYKITIRPTPDFCGSYVYDTIDVTVAYKKVSAAILGFDAVQSTCQPVAFSVFMGNYDEYIKPYFNYKFNFGDNTSLTSNTPQVFHQYVSPGKYPISVDITNGCGDTYTISDSVLIEQACLGVTSIKKEEEENFKFSIHPNPLTLEATINYSLTKQMNVEINLIDILGEKIQLYKNANGEVGNFKYILDTRQKKLIPGIYILKFQAGENILYKKLVVE